jgi:hypothetical protein
MFSGMAVLGAASAVLALGATQKKVDVVTRDGSSVEKSPPPESPQVDGPWHTVSEHGQLLRSTAPALTMPILSGAF